MIPRPVATLLAQAASPSAGEVDACGAADKASSLCRAIYRATGNQFLVSTADTVIVKPTKLFLLAGDTWRTGSARRLSRAVRAGAEVNLVLGRYGSTNLDGALPQGPACRAWVVDSRHLAPFTMRPRAQAMSRAA